MAVPSSSLWLVRFDPEDSIPRIGCFLSAFVHLLQTLPKEVSQSTATNGGRLSPKSKAEFRTPIVDFLCVKVLRRVKKNRTLVKKIQIEFVSKGS